ncbi:histone deacetylase [Streptomyces sp. NPDC048623]|uniref:histone deacetylase n=1 Tax=Streptomyces sp. NPDC048623 TaxID=3155761 RepID=UPI0034397949
MDNRYVWYAAYGSNMHRARLVRYLDGCRDRAAPRASRAVELDGVLYFATESAVWGGGRGFYDPDAAGRAFARAHLISGGQFSDIAALEMYGEPGADLDLAEVVARGRVAFGPGRYETVVCAGELDGRPLLTLTAPWALAEVELRPPSEAYLRHLAAGLRESGAWTDQEIARYLAGRPGAAGTWTPPDVLALLDLSETSPASPPPPAPPPPPGT